VYGYLATAPRPTAILLTEKDSLHPKDRGAVTSRPTTFKKFDVFLFLE
jgi:hypothetical protein